MDNNQEVVDQKLDRLLLLIEETLVEKQKDKEYREQHAEEHRFLRTLIEEKEVNTKFKRALLQNLANAGMWALIVATGSAITFTVKAWLTGKM